MKNIIEKMSTPVNLVEAFRRRNGTWFARINGMRTLKRNHPPIADIGWGYLGTINTYSYNNASAHVKAYANKLAARRHLQIHGISVPKSLFYGDTATEGVTYVVRPSYHQAGSNTTVRVGPFYVEHGTYASELVKKKREFRIHVAHGKVLACQEKVPREESRREDVVWNHHNGGFVFEVLKWKRWPIKACIEAIKAVESLGYTWGAVDVCYDENKTPYVFEVNSSPSLNEYMTEKYAKYFDLILSEQVNAYPAEESSSATGYGGVILKEVNYGNCDRE
jgi:hypothetical protein